MKLYSKDFHEGRLFIKKFSRTSPVWQRKDRDSLPYIAETVDDQDEIQSYEDTSMKAIFSRLLPDEQVAYFLGETSLVQPVEFTDEVVETGERYQETLDELTSIYEKAMEYREEYGLPMDMDTKDVFNYVKSVAEEGLKRYGHIRKDTGDSEPVRRNTGADTDSVPDNKEPVGENIKQNGGEEK